MSDKTDKRNPYDCGRGLAQRINEALEVRDNYWLNQWMRSLRKPTKRRAKR